MADLKQQRTRIKFCFKPDKTSAETQETLKETFGDYVLSQTQTYDWFKRFKNGRISVDNEERSARPSGGSKPEHVVSVRNAIVNVDRRQTI